MRHLQLVKAGVSGYLSKMQNLKFLVPLLSLVLLSASCASQTEVTYSDKPISHKIWTGLLQQYVSADGRVDYEGFQRSREQLGGYLELLSNNHPHPDKWSKSERLAYWINAYNAFTVELILEHYPLESIKDIKKLHIPLVNTPWHIEFFKIGGVSFNLEKIEHEILRKEFEEPRIHFAIVCASVSCPALLNEAYTADELERQLSSQARQFINDDSKNNIEPDKAQLSKIFKWFTGDFTKNGSLESYINQYSKVKITEKTKIRYLDYNWGLND